MTLTSIQLIVAIFISLLDIWTGMIVMGGIVYNLVDTSSYSGDILKRFFEKRIRNFIKRPFISLIIIVFLYMVTKRQESAVTYLIDGIACTLLLLTISCSDMLIGFLEKFPFSKMGKYSFEFYLLQIIWYEAFRVIYYKLSLLLSNSWLFIIYFLFIVITLSTASLFVNKITIIMKQYLYNFMFPIENQNKTI